MSRKAITTLATLFGRNSNVFVAAALCVGLTACPPPQEGTDTGNSSSTTMVTEATPTSSTGDTPTSTTGDNLICGDVHGCGPEVACKTDADCALDTDICMPIPACFWGNDHEDPVFLCAVDMFCSGVTPILGGVCWPKAQQAHVFECPGNEPDTGTTGAMTTDPGNTTGEGLCGNGKIDPGETCDGDDLNGATCQAYGADAGMVECNSGCWGYIIGGCYSIFLCDDGQDIDYSLDEKSPQCDGFPNCSDGSDEQGCLSCTDGNGLFPSEWKCDGKDDCRDASDELNCPVCGDAKIEDGEVCDDGTNDGGYGGCQPGCMQLGPRCGDGETDLNNGEECDSGTCTADQGVCNLGFCTIDKQEDCNANGSPQVGVLCSVDCKEQNPKAVPPTPVR